MFAFVRHHFHGLGRPASILATCLVATAAGAATSRLYPPQKDEAGARRLTEVVHVWPREEILGPDSPLQLLLASGLKDSDLTDGSLATGRVNCCNESTEYGTAMWFYVPPDLKVDEGDIVVIRMGRKPGRQDSGAVNVATEVRQKKDVSDSHCTWDPPDPNLWMRVLYCDWMPSEGWTLKKGLYKTWLKRASEDKAE